MSYYRIESNEGVVISSIDFSHVYYPGSTTPNMHEVVGLRFREIEWNYVKGNIKYDDVWIKQKKETQSAQYWIRGVMPLSLFVVRGVKRLEVWAGL